MIHIIRDRATPEQMKEMLETLKKDFEHLSKSPSYGVFELFDIISWLESKISGVNVQDVIREKFLKGKRI